MERLLVPGESRSLLHRWQLVVDDQPDRPAVHSPGRAYTFGQVDQIAEHVAAELQRRLGEDDGTPVGLLVSHNAEGLIGLLAVMKADRIVVTLDPHLPTDRLRVIQELAGTRLCLADGTNRSVTAELGFASQDVVDLDALVAEAVTDRADRPPASTAPALLRRQGSDAAAIVFTSGSTGRPKGVLQTHDQLLNDVYAHGQRYAVGPQDRVALVLPYGFAAGLALIFVTLLEGGSLWCFDPRDRGTRRLVDWVTEQRLTTLHCTPHLLRSLVGVLPAGSVLDSLRLVATVGEAVHGSDVAAIRTHLPADSTFVNWTGSSEIGTLALHQLSGADEVPSGTVPAGQVVPNKEALILGEDGTPVADGEAGELVAVSRYLSGGYWRNDQESAARFGVWPDGRPLCRQGDLARIDEDGHLVLLGRSDAAVKVRGYLVDLSEIEAAFMSEEGVLDVVVVPVVDPPAPTRLAAYVVPDPALRTQSPAALRRALRQRLPEYMVPAAIVAVTELPRNERGKVDRQQLPDVEQLPPSAPPSNQWEIAMSDLWSEVLGLDQIGLDDDFLALGGDSLSAEEMLISVQERFGVGLVSSDLVEAPTLREFTRRATMGGAVLPSHPDVTVLQRGDLRPPLFCFAGSGGLALAFLPLSRYFSDRTVYGFQAHGLEQRALPDWSVERAARRHLQLVRLVQPSGPYVLLGYSFGGLVALEIARMLVRAGERVQLVGLLDTYLPRSAGQQPTYDYETLPVRPAAERAPGPLRRQLERANIQGLPPVRTLGKHLRARTAGIVPYSGQLQFDAFFDQENLVMRRHRVEPYDGRTLVALAHQNPDGQEAWRDYLTGEHRFVEVAADHSSLLREPHAAGVAAAIAEELAGR